MLCKSFAVAVAGICSVTFAANIRGNADSVLGGCVSSDSYDYMLLVEQWPPGACAQFGCNVSTPYFTLHGLWPNNNDGTYPCNCNGQAFNPNDLTSIESELNKYWPSYNGANSGFWDHEWTKHGTCAVAGGPGVLTDELSFFQHTLDLRSKNDLAFGLRSAGIVPSNTQSYSLSDVHAAIQKATGHTGAVTCDGKGSISSIVSCVGKDLSGMDCPSATPDQCSQSNVYLRASTT